MADAITGGRRVMLSTDTASRRALRSVNKVAATTNDVIHLDTSAVASGRMDEVIAHELTHVAHPSATPRFFDDIDHSPEERKAEQMAELIARSPLAPNAHAARRMDGGGSTPAPNDVIRRTPATSTPSAASAASSPGTVSAAALADRITGRSSAPTTSTSPAPVQRKATPASAAAAAPAAPAPAAGGAPAANAGSMLDNPEAEQWFADQLDRNFDRLLGIIEDRMIMEFERRGGRIWGGL